MGSHAGRVIKTPGCTTTFPGEPSLNAFSCALNPGGKVRKRIF